MSATLARRAKVLLVDDRPDNLLALVAILQGLGHELVQTQSGEEALKRLLTDSYAVILLDVQMPGMDGFETAAHIKRRGKTRDTPIVFLTAATSDAHQTMRGYATGAVDYLAKPFDPWILRAKVSYFAELHLRELESGRRVAELSDALAQVGSAVARVEAALDRKDTSGARRELAELQNRLEDVR